MMSVVLSQRQIQEACAEYVEKRTRGVHYSNTHELRLDANMDDSTPGDTTVTVDVIEVEKVAAK